MEGLLASDLLSISLQPPKPRAQPGAAKSGTVIKMGGLRSVAPPPTPAPAPAVSSSNESANGASSTSVASQPTQETAVSKQTVPRPEGEKRLSVDDATDRALRSGDRAALEKALAKRSNEPLDQTEMMEIARVMLGETLGAGGAGDVSAALAGLNAAPPPSTGHTATRTQEPLDSDDEGDEDSDGGAQQFGPSSSPSIAAEPPPPPAPPPRPLPPPPPAESIAAPSAETTEAQLKDPTTAQPKAEYELRDLGECMELLLRVPDAVSSVSELEVDLTSARVQVGLKGTSLLQLALPRQIDEAAAAAKFAKKKHQLRLTAPYNDTKAS